MLFGLCGSFLVCCFSSYEFDVWFWLQNDNGSFRMENVEFSSFCVEYAFNFWRTIRFQNKAGNLNFPLVDAVFKLKSTTINFLQVYACSKIFL